MRPEGGCKVNFFEKCDFVGIHEGSSLEHEGTTIDAAGGRVPPASHEPSKEVARARGIGFQKIPLAAGRRVYTPAVSAARTKALWPSSW